MTTDTDATAAADAAGRGAATPTIDDAGSPLPDFRRLVETVPNLVWSCRGDGACEYLSPQWVAYTGRPAEAQLGAGWLEVVHPADRAATAERWAAAVAAGGTFDTEFRIRRHDGAYRWFATRAVPEVDAAGAIVRWYGTNTDIHDRRDAEEALRALQRTLEGRVEDRGRALGDARVQLEMAQRITRTGSWSYDLAANHVMWSDELFRVLRLPVSDVCPQYAEQPALFHPDSWPILDAAVTRAATEGVPYRLELRLADSGEGPRYAVAQCEVVRGADGRPRLLYGTFQDVTELVRARMERDAAHEMIALATAFGGIGVWDWHVDEGRLEWNDEMYRLFDVPSGTTPTYEVWRAAVAPDDLAATESALAQMMTGDHEFASTYRVPQRDGTTRVIRATARMPVRAPGTPRRVLGVCLDVTAEATVQRVQADAIATLREFIRSAPASIAMLDRERGYVEISDRWREQFDVGAADATGRTSVDPFGGDGETLARLHAAVLTGATRRGTETPITLADGTPRFVSWEARPWHTPDGAIGGMLLFMYDVTEPVRLRRAVERQSEELRRSNEDLQQFAYAASHDLQEPLRAVTGFAQVLARRYTGRLDADADVILGHLTQGGARMQALIDGLLLFSRAGSTSLTRRRVPLETIVESARANLAQAIAESGARIACGTLPAIAVDPVLMTQVFQNLLGNAIKYAGGAVPQVEITALPVDDGHEIVVRDHGIGVSASALERVFQMFQRLHTRDELPGTGIGLALCRRIVERHGGRIRMALPDGPGCAVHVWLPDDGEAIRDA